MGRDVSELEGPSPGPQLHWQSNAAAATLPGTSEASCTHRLGNRVQESVTSACCPSGSQIITTLGGLEDFNQSGSYSDKGWGSRPGEPCFHSPSQYSLGEAGTSLGEDQGSTGWVQTARGRAAGQGEENVTHCELKTRTASSSAPPPRPILAEDRGLLQTSTSSRAVLIRTQALGSFLMSQPLLPYLPAYISRVPMPRWDARVCHGAHSSGTYMLRPA